MPMKTHKVHFTGFTLMELLLMIAVVAVVAAVGVSTFYRSSITLNRDARLARVMSNYELISEAIRAQLEFEKNTPSLPSTRRLSGSTDGDDGVAGSRISILIDNGFLTKTAAAWETQAGAVKKFEVKLLASKRTDLPPFLREIEGYGVYTAPLLKDIATELRERGAASTEAAWLQIWSALNP